MFQCSYMLCVYIDMQFLPSQDILPRYGQWFPGIDHRTCTLDLCHFKDFFSVVVGLNDLVLGDDDKTLYIRAQLF